MFCDSQILPGPSILKDIQILVVDNDADSRYLHKELFEIYGAQVTTTESIADAMTLLEHLVPDIVICEIRFFDEDVSALFQKVKAVALSRERVIPILVVSASCLANFAQNLLAMVEDYLLKPIDVNYLVDKVWDLICVARLTEKVNIQDWVAKPRDWIKHHTAQAQSQHTPLLEEATIDTRSESNNPDSKPIPRREHCTAMPLQTGGIQIGFGMS